MKKLIAGSRFATVALIGTLTAATLTMVGCATKPTYQSANQAGPKIITNAQGVPNYHAYSVAIRSARLLSAIVSVTVKSVRSMVWTASIQFIVVNGSSCGKVRQPITIVITRLQRHSQRTHHL